MLDQFKGDALGCLLAPIVFVGIILMALAMTGLLRSDVAAILVPVGGALIVWLWFRMHRAAREHWEPTVREKDKPWHQRKWR